MSKEFRQTIAGLVHGSIEGKTINGVQFTEYEPVLTPSEDSKDLYIYVIDRNGKFDERKMADLEVGDVIDISTHGEFGFVAKGYAQHINLPSLRVEHVERGENGEVAIFVNDGNHRYAMSNENFGIEYYKLSHATQENGLTIQEEERNRRSGFPIEEAAREKAKGLSDTKILLAEMFVSDKRPIYYIDPYDAMFINKHNMPDFAFHIGVTIQATATELLRTARDDSAPQHVLSIDTTEGALFQMTDGINYVAATDEYIVTTLDFSQELQRAAELRLLRETLAERYAENDSKATGPKTNIRTFGGDRVSVYRHDTGVQIPLEDLYKHKGERVDITFRPLKNFDTCNGDHALTLPPQTIEGVTLKDASYSPITGAIIIEAYDYDKNIPHAITNLDIESQYYIARQNYEKDHQHLNAIVERTTTQAQVQDFQERQSIGLSLADYSSVQIFDQLTGTQLQPHEIQPGMKITIDYNQTSLLANGMEFINSASIEKNMDVVNVVLTDTGDYALIGSDGIVSTFGFDPITMDAVCQVTPEEFEKIIEGQDQSAHQFEQ